jgi:hypothetical protein
MIPNEMMTNLNMLCLVVLHRVASDLDCTFIVTQKRHFVKNDTIVLQSLPHSYCAQQLAAAINSASVVERDTQFCFLDDQHTKDLPRKWQAPEVDFGSTLSSAQSESE